MIIYNTTYLVSDKVYAGFIKWLKVKHIPHMLTEGKFDDARICKVITEEAQEGTSISVQLSIPSMVEFEVWNQQSGDLFRMELASHFSEEVLCFSTFMEEIS